MDNSQIDLYADGSSQPNPGAGGAAWVIKYWEIKDGNELPEVVSIENSQGYELTTNNRMEVLSCLGGLYDIIKNIEADVFKNVTQINLLSDSKYFCDTINQKWIDKWIQNNWVTYTKSPVKNRDLWEKLQDIQNKLHGLNVILMVTHIPGHQGVEGNERCDKLAQAAARSNSRIKDDVYEKASRNGR